MSDIDDSTEINILPEDVLDEPQPPQVDDEDLVSISVSVPAPEALKLSPLEALARTRYFDLDREPPHWLQVIEREGRIGRFFARRISNFLTWKGGWPFWKICLEYWFEIVVFGAAIAGSVAFNVWVWRRP